MATRMTGHFLNNPRAPDEFLFSAQQPDFVTALGQRLCVFGALADQLESHEAVDDSRVRLLGQADPVE